MKDDIAQFREACNRRGLTPAERKRFGQWLHDYKSEGNRGSGPNRDFTRDELLSLIDDFKQEQS